MTIESIDFIKFVTALAAALVFLVAFLAPVRWTIYPYWKEYGRPSGIMLGRVGIRLLLFLLAVNEAIFPLNRLLGLSLSPALIVADIVPLLAILSILFIYSWIKHPQGISGL